MFENLGKFLSCYQRRISSNAACFGFITQSNSGKVSTDPIFYHFSVFPLPSCSPQFAVVCKVNTSRTATVARLAVLLKFRKECGSFRRKYAFPTGGRKAYGQF